MMFMKQPFLHILFIFFLSICSLQAFAQDEETRLQQTLDAAISANGEMSEAAHNARVELTDFYWDSRAESSGRLYRAAPYLQKVLEYYQQNGGGKSEIVRTRFRLGRSLRIRGQFSEAIPHLEFVYERWNNKWGEGNQKTLAVMHDLGAAYVSIDNMDRALPMLERLVAGSENLFGDSHPRTAIAYIELGKAYYKKNQYKKAKKLARDAYGILDGKKSPQFKHTNRALLLLAQIAWHNGEQVKAERLLQKAIANYSRVENVQGTPLMNVLITMLGRVYLSQGRLGDAQSLLEKSLASVKAELGAGNKRVAKVEMILSVVYLRNNQPQKAADYLQDAVATLESIGLTKTRTYARAVRQQVQANVRIGKLDQADKSMQKLNAVINDHEDDPVFIGPAYFTRGIYAKAKKDYSVAEENLKKAVARMDTDFGRNNALTQRMLTVLGEVLREQGKYKEAISVYQDLIGRTSVFLSKRFSESKTGRDQQEQFISENLEKYLSLLAQVGASNQQLDIDLAAESFHVAENMRSRSLQSAVLGMAARTAVDDSYLAEQIRKEQDVRKELGKVEEEMLALINGFGGQANRQTKQYLRRRVLLNKELNEINEEIARKFPEYNRLVNPQPADIEHVRKILGDDEVLLSFYSLKDQTLVWAISKNKTEFREIKLGAADMQNKIGKLRGSLDVNVSYLSDIPKYDVALAYELYNTLIGPSKKVFAHAKNIIIVPHRAMFSMPFGALLQKPVKLVHKKNTLPFSEYKTLPWLARDYALNIMPSATAMVTLRQFHKQINPDKSFIGFGDPQFSNDIKNVKGGVAQRGIHIAQRALLNTRNIRKLPNLPETSKELRDMAVALKADVNSDVYLRDRATEENVRSKSLDDYSVIAFATHGLVAGDLDGLNQPALALTPPATPSDKDDGLLQMSEVLGLKLNADWVILSACNTASGDGTLHSDGLTGLAQAFFYAGSRAMLVSLWPVESTSTELLTTTIFNNNAGLKRYQRAAALQVARMRLINGKGYIENGKEQFSYAHPIFWSAFMIVGEGSRQ